MARVTISDLGGSLNQGRAPAFIGENEYTQLSNFYQFGGKLRRRGGMRKINNARYSEGVTGVTVYRPDQSSLTNFDAALGTATGFAKLNGDVITAITPQTNFSIATSNRPWTMFQYKNILYGLREFADLIRSDGTYFGPAGIPAPTGAATLADGGAGSLTGDFIGVYTFYNANNGMESNPSPVSNTLTIAGKKVNWSGIGTSTNVQVTSRRLYRTLPNQSGEYFFVAEIPNNVDTTYTGDNVLVQDMGDAVSFANGEPPDGLILGDIWKERLFASDGVDLFHSEDGLIEAFDPEAVIPVFPDDGHRLSAVHGHGDRLMIGKTNKIHFLVGSDPSNFQLLTLTDRHGCVSHHSMQSAEGYLFWLGVDNVYRSDGNSVTGIASIKIRDILASFDAEQAKDAVAAVFPKLGWYVLALANSPDQIALIYNYKTDVWAQVLPQNFINAFGDFYDTSGEHHIYCTDILGSVYEFADPDYDLDDHSSLNGHELASSITSEATTRAFQSDPGTKHVVIGVGIQTARVAENITLAIESEGTTVKQRTVSLDYEPRMKSYLLSTRHQAKEHSQLHITYSGEEPIEIESLYVDIEPLGRPAMQPV